MLADRGLAAALAALAARSPVPVDLAVDLPAERLAPVTENTAYFVVSEALANVAKHSGATTCRVERAAAATAGCGSSSRTTAAAGRCSLPGTACPG